MKITVMDMQPIDPPIGGGRLRLLGLYSGFKNNIEAVYIGSYDWRGPTKREHMLSACLQEIDIPLSEEHFTAHDRLSIEIGKSCIDTSFPLLGHLSADLINGAVDKVKDSDIVIFSHPWMFPFVAPYIDERKQLLVYDSQNFEGALRVKLLDNQNPKTLEVINEAVRCECELCRAAHLVFACSEEDKNSFVDIYGIDRNKVIIVPNGVFSEQVKSVENTKEKEQLRKKLGIAKPALCFIGSSYFPNEEAARLIIETADCLPEYQFILIGGVSESLKDIDISKHENVIITGFVDEKEKIQYLQASDAAVNPMLSGSGTNIKMFDFMAAGLPIITTKIGARGIKNTENCLYDVCGETKEELSKSIKILIGNENKMSLLAKTGRKEACEKYSWEQISYELGYRLTQKYRQIIKNQAPYFSIIIPTYERHDLLSRLLDNLLSQTFKDFEVVIIDQSKEVFQHLEKYKDMDITYFTTKVKGAVKARNTGIRLAKGEIAAFIDDDCIPEAKWLYNAAKKLSRPGVVGVEGLIEADIYDHTTHRVVTNLDFEGIGFMTANLFVRLDVLNQIDGFDESFDNPHFREDTDLGWRVQQFGEVPYVKDVVVLHPSHPRNIERESAEERNKFFVHDPLLLKKHPEKFAQLFVSEDHYKIPEYWVYFKEGMRRHGVTDRELEDLISRAQIDRKYITEY